MKIRELNLALNEEKLQFHKELNKDLWDNGKLKTEVGIKLIEIATAFLEYLNVEELVINDILLTGSNCQYNYTSQSDIDLHIIADFDKLPTECPLLAQEYFNSKKKIFNDNHDITIYGYKVELYVEDVKQPAKSNGKYSLLYQKWVNYPTSIDIEIDNIEELEKYQNLVTTIENILTSEYNIDEANEILNDLYDMRKAGLELGGELSDENLIFKTLRNNGYLTKLRNYIKTNYDKSLSLY